MSKLVKDALEEAATRLIKAGVSSPLLDAQILTSHALGIDRAAMLSRLNEQINERQWHDQQSFVSRRENREPVAYITGDKEFYSINFSVDHRTLIPRPETELLVEAALEYFDENNSVNILDLCAGCGAIAIALARNRSHWKVTASDISIGACEVTKQNAHDLGLVDRVEIVKSDLFENFQGRLFDLIVTNPPYVVMDDPALDPEVRMYEPEIALYAEDDGLAIIQKIINEAHSHLNPGGVLMLEIGYGQAVDVIDMFERSGNFSVDRRLVDLQGIERAISAKRI